MRLVFLLMGVGVLFLVGCQNNQNLFDQSITSINVQTYVSSHTQEKPERITTITDQDFIDELTHALETTKTESTANLDIPGPDYWLLFKYEDTIVKEMGYYTEDKRFNYRTGRYIDSQGDWKFQGVTLELPIE